MSQQINLVNDALRRQKDILSPLVLVRLVAGFFLLLCLIAGYLFQQTYKLEAERANWARQAENAKNSLTQTAQQFPSRQPSAALQAELKDTEAKTQSRDRVLHVLNSGSVGQSQGFSALMESFARQGVNGLWLTGISVSGAGDQMRISGSAMSADLIPQYIARLSSEPALRGRKFTALQVGQPKPMAPVAQSTAVSAVAPPYVEFVLSAEAAEKPLDAAGKATAEIRR